MVLIKKGRCHFFWTTARFHPQEVLKLLDYRIIYANSSEVRGLYAWWNEPCKMLQNLPYFIYINTQIGCLPFSFCGTLLIFSRHLSEKYVKYHRKWKMEKESLGTWNMTNFEAFYRIISSSIKLLLLKIVTILYVLCTR